MQLTKDFSLEEFVKSPAAVKFGIDNTPDEKQIEALRYLAESVLQPARDIFQAPITINSGFRCDRLNSVIGGAKTSQHRLGEAADIDSSDNARLFSVIRELAVYDQLIWEFGSDYQPDWIHVSAKRSGNRMQILKAITEEGKTKYIHL